MQLHMSIFFTTFAADLKCKPMKRIWMSMLLAWCTLSMWAGLPEVTLRDMNGKSVNVATLTQSGKPVIVSFFATWCKPCMQELEALDALYADWQEQYGVTIYIVSTDQGQDSQKVKPLVEGNGWEYQVLLDPNAALKREMNVRYIPHMFIFNAKGEQVYTHVGYQPGDENEIPTYLR